MENILYKEFDLESLEEYGNIPFFYRTNKKYELNKVNNGLGGITLDVVEVEEYYKDFGTRVSSWGEMFDLSNWKLQPRLTKQMFANCVNLETIGNVSNWDFSNNLDTSDMFVNCEKLELDMSMVPMNISVSKVRMFKDANKKIKKPKFK